MLRLVSYNNFECYGSVEHLGFEVGVIHLSILVLGEAVHDKLNCMIYKLALISCTDDFNRVILSFLIHSQTFHFT